MDSPYPFHTCSNRQCYTILLQGGAPCLRFPTEWHRHTCFHKWNLRGRLLHSSNQMSWVTSFGSNSGDRPLHTPHRGIGLTMPMPETRWNVDHHIKGKEREMLWICFVKPVLNRKFFRFFLLVIHTPQQNIVSHENYALPCPPCGMWIGSSGELFPRNSKTTGIAFEFHMSFKCRD